MGWFQRRTTFEDLVAYAEEMRRNPTPAERRALELLADSFGRSSFKHQRIIGPFIVDFVFLGEKVVVELDGAVHDSLRARWRDSERDHYLRDRGFYVLRVPNGEVFENPGRVLNEIDELRTRRSGWAGRLFSGRRRL